MAISKELLEILVCPETKLPVQLASQSVVENLNAKIIKGELKNRGGTLVKEKIDSGLIRSDEKILYPIRQDIPVMLQDEGIELQ